MYSLNFRSAGFEATSSASGTPLSVSTATNQHHTTAPAAVATLPTLTTVTSAAAPPASSSIAGSGVGVGTGGGLPQTSYSQYHLASAAMDYPPPVQQHQQHQPPTGGVSGAQLNKALTISNQVSLVYEVHDWWSEQVIGGAGSGGSGGGPATIIGSGAGAGGYGGHSGWGAGPMGGGLIMGAIGSFMQDDDDGDDY